MSESGTWEARWWSFGMGALAGFGLALCLPCKAHAQEAVLASLRDVVQAERTWSQAPFPVPSPAWGPPLREAAPEPPGGRQMPIPDSAAARIVRDAEHCVVDWHSQRRKRASRITCWAKG